MTKRNNVKQRIVSYILLCLLVISASGVFTLLTSPITTKAAANTKPISFSGTVDCKNKAGSVQIWTGSGTVSLTTFGIDISKSYVYNFELSGCSSSAALECTVSLNGTNFVYSASLDSSGVVDIAFTGTLTYTLPDYTVTFDLNGGTRTGGGALTQTVEHGSAATAPTATKEGYKLSGWNSSLNNITAAKTITANWVVATYLVTFNLDGGERIGGGALTQTVEHGFAAVAPIASKEGYFFDGWSAELTNITAIKTITALWSLDEPTDPTDPTDPGEPTDPDEPIKEYSVFFLIDNDNAVVSGNIYQVVRQGKYAVAPQVSCDGYVFHGWLAGDNVVVTDLKTYPITERTVFTAIWSIVGEDPEEAFRFTDIWFWNWNEDTPATAKTVGWIINAFAIFCLLLLVFKRR